MKNPRTDVAQALESAGWTSDDQHLPTRRNGPAYWVVKSGDGTSVLGVDGWVAEFAPAAPTVVIVAACLAAAGQPERLADVIQLRPNA